MRRSTSATASAANDVGARAATNDADVQGDAALQIGQLAIPPGSDATVRGWRSVPSRSRDRQCEACPVTLMMKLPTPLRAVFSAPPGPAGSQTKTASHCVASFSVRARELSLPSSSSETSHTLTGRGRPPFTSRSARKREHDLHDAALHVEHARAVQASLSASRHGMVARVPRS